ncbi:hypothetical protein GCK32_000650 [Trichostrongylus colubriformis]|uniref:Peptidase A2 domain-containing protein n=1 Tax=Trichostrongylus colubriformis TaxID=6319 RepID=A0AAN8IQ42_TRICO
MKKSAEQPHQGVNRASQAQKVDRPTTKINNVGQTISTEEQTSILEPNSEEIVLQTPDTYLPTGQATVLDPASKIMRKITVLLDTGAQISFIDSTLAEELHLTTIAQVKLKISTFRSKEIKEKLCRRVMLDIWDINGEPLTLKLLTHESSFAVPPIREDDIKFLQTVALPLLVVTTSQ